MAKIKLSGVTNVLLVAAVLVMCAVVVIVLSGALTGGDPQHPRPLVAGPEHVDLPGIGTVYIFPLHGHWYICNPRGELTHAVESCACKQPLNAERDAPTNRFRAQP